MKSAFVSNNLCDSQPILWSLKGQGNEMFLFLFFYEWAPQILPCMHFLGTVFEFFSNFGCQLEESCSNLCCFLQSGVGALRNVYTGELLFDDTKRTEDSSRFSFVPPRFRNQISKSVHISSPLWSWFTQQKLRKMFCQVPATPFSKNIICCCEVITEFSNRHLPTVNCHQNRL